MADDTQVPTRWSSYTSRVDSGRRRARILREAAALFIANGFSGVTMDDVQTAVGGSKATLYKYFSDKSDLFRSAVEMLIDERSQPLTSFHPSGGDPVETLKEFGRHFAAIVLDSGAIALHRLVTSEAERVDGLGQMFFQHGPAVGNAILGRYLGTLRDAGIIEVADPVLAASQLYQAMLGSLQMRLLMNTADRPTSQEIESSITHAVNTFVDGTRLRTPQPRAADATTR
ncbi:TetR/AcrR family transcriptional regulator [Pseudofrankia sp. EUN1h]|uniref:TetR/AcrR family transcriptional regulator n=1 Tax=Pseudofrankia sp. EUN1h TaxID=1834515 RepID=UPI001F51EAB9|nr:TetR/AcrR family transcriptional regulator [Pseudofrankia sp. EUN1h]